MPTFDEREHLVREFCVNTGASDRLARDVLIRNKWNLSNSYKEVEQMCVSSNRSSSSMPPAPPYPHHEGIRPVVTPSRGGMEGGIGPAVSLDTRGVRPPARSVAGPVSGDSGPRIHPVEGLKVALPPVRSPAERVIPVQVDGERTQYQAGAPVPPSTAVARIKLDDKVFPSQPGMVAPRMSTSNNKTPSQNSVPTTQPSPASHQHDTYPRLKRGFSSITENEMLVSAARSSVLQDIKEDNHANMFQTFVLPDFTVHPEAFKTFLMKELIESSTLNSLELSGRLNWWAHYDLCQRLFPMATTGDGNCLLHAASLAMWGIHDRQLTLRIALHDSLTSSTYKDNLYRRWRWQQTLVNQQSGLVFTEAEWKAEWENILRLASPSPRSGPDSGTNINSCCDSPLTSSSSTTTDPVVYESLEEFHVFVLAHVLQRPIIVVADTILRDANGEALAPIPFGGIYLPLECSRVNCYTSPLLLTYDAAHFSALVPMQHASSSTYDVSVPLAIPVVDPHLKLLPLHFSHDPGPKFDWSSLSNKDISSEPGLEDRLNLIKAYMDIIQLSPDAAHITNPSVTSRQSSSGSEDGGSLNSTLLKEKKKEGKQNTVAKQFGSFGKTMGKKLKNLGNNLAPNKGGGKMGDQDEEKGQLVSLGGGLSQSTKFITALATTGNEENEEFVYCARLACEYQDTRDVFIENYLQDAQKRFRVEQDLKRQRGEDQRSRVSLQSQATTSQRHICHTVGCSNNALPNISLCDRCASQQQWQQGCTLDKSRSKGNGQQLGYNTFPGRHKAPTGLPSNAATSDEIYKCGKSKFYTPTHPEPPLPPATLQILRHDNRQLSMSTGNVAHRHPAARPRSPSPDYDNVHYGNEPNPKCATVGCDFYGNKETGYLCSGCYRKKSQQPQLAKPEKTTRL